jgi:hypothetical protein
MTEAAVSCAGNLTVQPELRHTDSGIAWAMFRVAVGAGAVLLHRDHLASPRPPR